MSVLSKGQDKVKRIWQKGLDGVESWSPVSLSTQATRVCLAYSQLSPLPSSCIIAINFFKHPHSVPPHLIVWKAQLDSVGFCQAAFNLLALPSFPNNWAGKYLICWCLHFACFIVRFQEALLLTDARGWVPFCRSLTMAPYPTRNPPASPPRCSSISWLDYFVFQFDGFFYNYKLKREIYTQLTMSLKTQAEIIFVRFSGCPFSYHVCLTIQLDHLSIVTIETRQPLMDSSVHVHPIFLFVCF